jgi:Domain of unknown function (DUF4175)
MKHPSVDPFIQAAAGRRHVARALRWACHSVILLLAPLAVLAWADNLWVLSTNWRWLALVLAASALAVACASVFRVFRRPSVGEAARVLDESSALDRGYAVSTSSELAGKAPANPVEEALLERLHLTAAQLAAEARPVHPWPGRTAIVAGLAATTAFLTIAAKENGLALRRALQPWTDIPYTTIHLAGPAEPPAKREPFEITGKISGRIPRELHLSWTGGRSATVPVDADGNFRHPLALGIQQDSTFSAQAASDGRSVPLAIALRQIPKVASYHFDINSPAYTRWPASVETHPGFVTLRGTKVALTLQLDLPAQSVVFIPDNNQGEITFANPSGDGKSWQAALGKMERTFSYRIEITDAKSTYQAEADPQMIVVTPDAPPKFESFTHNADELAGTKPPDEFSLKFRATDDIGLNRMIIKCEALAKEIAPVKSTQLTEHPSEYSGSWSIPLQALRNAGVQPMDFVIVTVTVEDGNNESGPGSVSEPIFLEMPFPPADGKAGDEGGGDGGGGGSGQQPENVNPLALQKELHRSMVRFSLGLKAPAVKELEDQENTIVGHLKKMSESPESSKLGGAYVNHLKEALSSAMATAMILNRPGASGFMGSPGMTRYGLGRSTYTLMHLIEAAKIEAEAMKQASQNPSGGGEGQQPGGQKPEPKYSLIKPPTKSKPDKDSEKEDQKQEKIEQAVADIDQLQKDQQQLDKEAAELAAKNEESKEGEGKEGEGKQGQAQGGDPKGGQTKPGPSQGQSASQLAANQDALSAKLSEILKDLGSLEAGDSQTDPKQAAEALKAAKEYQQKIAEALRSNNLSQAAGLGSKTEEALDVANLLTKSLLDKQVRQSIEAQVPAPGYESLIQEYSRRISYDQ